MIVKRGENRQYITKSTMVEINDSKLQIATSNCKEFMNALDMKGAN